MKSFEAGTGLSSLVTSSTVIKALASDPTLGTTVQGLIELANRAVAGMATGGATLSDINGALDAINSAFDECHFVVPCR